MASELTYDDLTDDEKAEVHAAAGDAAVLAVARIQERRMLGARAHVVAHERIQIDPDEHGKPTGWADQMLDCPDCGRPLQGMSRGPRGEPALICPRLARVAGSLELKTTPHDVIACGLTPDGRALDG